MAATTVSSLVPNSSVQSSNVSNTTPEVNREYPKKLVIRSQNRIFLQTVSEIDYLTAAANYVHIHSGAQVSRIRSTINAIEQRLDPQKFGRIHRCTIVNLERVTEFRPLQRGDYMLKLQGGTELKMSRRHRSQLEKLIGSGGLGGSHVLKYAGANNQQSGASAANSRSGRNPSVS